MSRASLVIDFDGSTVDSPLAAISRETFQATAVVLAIQSGRCLVIPPDDVTNVRWQSHATLAIDLESYLPTDAEELAVDICRERGIAKLAVACDKSDIDRVVQQIEAAGGWIATISPFALLAAQALVRQKAIPPECDLAIQSGDKAWDLIQLRKGMPTIWQWVAEGEVQARCEQGHDDGTLPLYVVCNEEHSLKEWVRSNSSSHESTACHWLFGDSPRQAVEDFAPALVAGKVRPWIDFRRGGVACADPLKPIQTPLAAFAASVVISMALLFGFLWWRTTELARQIESRQDEQAQLFKELFPRQGVPTDIPGRLRSEEKKLLLAVADLRQELPVESSLPILVHWLNQLPSNSKFRIDKIRLQGAQIQSLDGVVESLEDFEEFTKALRQSGYEFNPPSFVQADRACPLKIDRIRIKAPKGKESKS